MEQKRPTILDTNDALRDEYCKKFYELTAPDRMRLLQDILRKTDAKFEEINDITDDKEMTRFVDSGYFDDMDELKEELFEYAGFNKFMDMLVCKSKILVSDAEVFRERFTINEVIDVYPSIWMSALCISNISLSKEDLTVTVNGKPPVLDGKFADNDCIEVNFNYEGQGYTFKYVRDEVYRDMLDYRVLDHIQDFLEQQNIDLYLLTTDYESHSLQYLLPSLAVEELDKYKERPYVE